MSPTDASSYHRGEPRSSLERVEAALTQSGHRFTKRGDHLQAVCPSHEDSRPSLSVDFKGEGRTVLNCQAHCAGDDVIAALGLTWPELYDDYEAPEIFAARRREERSRGMTRPKPSRPQVKTERVTNGALPKKLLVKKTRGLGEWQVIAAYPYPDVDGTLTQEEVRSERDVEVTDAAGTARQKREKRFSQRWPGTQGEWLNKAPSGFQPVLYRLPDVVDWVEAGRIIWLCEGVKDADRFIDLGEAATTNPSGARNFKAHQADYLVNAHVTVVVDHDLAGYARAVQLYGLLADKVAQLRFALPRTTEAHSDASDHFDAGHGLNFAEASIEHMIALEQVAAAEELASKAADAVLEVNERLRRASRTEASENAERERAAAGRWAEETGALLLKLRDLRVSDDVSEELQQRRDVAADAVVNAVWAAYDAAGLDLPAAVVQAAADPTQLEPEDPAADHVEDEPTAERPSGKVLNGPGAQSLPQPSHRIPMSRGTWAYELGGADRRERGVYVLNDERWVRVAGLPFIQARIIERDGTGRRTGTQWLASAEEGGSPLVIGWEDLSNGRWSNMLDVWVSRDKRVEETTATAFEIIGHQAEERERTPRVVEDGRISVPVPDTLPGGYLITGDLDRDAALTQWREILTTAAASPRLAMVLGAAAVGPFVAALKRQSHIVALYGDSDNGKSVTMNVAGSIWGDTLSDAGVVQSWNATGLGPLRFLGQLGVLPGFFDEAGQASANSPREWGKLIYDICEGAQRMGAEQRGLGVRVTMPWHGVMISAGNGRLTDGLGAGRYAGVAKRVVDVETPLTVSAEHAETLKALLPGVGGHLGHEILDRYTAETVAPMIVEAEKILGMPEGGNERTVARHLHAHLAGAQMLDQITGAEGALYYAALQGAVEYLEQWAPPEHDADRMLDAIRDAIGREPAMWPDVEDYLEHKRTPTLDSNDFGPRLPGHGINRTMSGIVSTNTESGTQTVWVFSHMWKALCEELGADSAVACRELNKRDVLRRTDSSRRANEWTTKVRTTGSKMYELRFGPHLDDETGPVTRPQQPSSAPSTPHQTPTDDLFSRSGVTAAAQGGETAPVPGDGSGRSGSVPGDVPGTNVALTCSVPGVPGSEDKASHVPAHVEPQAAPKPRCIVCGEPASQRVDDQPMHLGGCALTYDRAQRGVDVDQVPAVDEAISSSSPAAEEGHTAAASSSSTSATPEPRGSRFSAPAACLSADGLHLAGGTTLDWPAINHLGDLAILTSRDHLKLGWGGGEDRLPDPGQIWLYADALERLGFPTSMALPEDKALNRSQRSKETRKMFARLDDHPMVAGALEAGWELGQGGHLGVWSRIWHPELLPGGAFLVGLPWHRIEGVPLFAGDPDPSQLADRLAAFASHVGVTYRMTAAATGLDLIDHHRPPRRSVDDDLGSGRGRVALVKRVGAELPDWRKNTKDARFNAIGQDFSWWRQWDKLGESEQALPFVHAYDRNASYLTPWQNIDLGVEGLEHRTGDAARWDGKESPGYYLIDGWDWPAWGLPGPSGAKVSGGRVWVNVHTLKQLAMVGIEPAVHESYTWALTTRYLTGPGKALSQARTALQAAPGDDQAARQVLAQVKLLYAATVGKLAERDHAEDYHLWRPDWQDHIVSATKTQILRVLQQIQENSGVSPLVVDRDAVFFASAEADPVKAWPGDPAKLGTKIGAWKPANSAELGEWGPTFLTKRPGRWPYADAVAAMQAPGTVGR